MSMTHKEKAEQYVREKLPELMKETSGCKIRLTNYDEADMGEEYPVEQTINFFWNTDYGEGASVHTLESFGPLEYEYEVIGHPIQLQHWLRVLESYEAYWQVSGMLDGYIFDDENNYRAKIKFNLTTGQPATEADYQAFNEIVGV